MTGEQIGWFRFRLIRNERMKGSTEQTWRMEDSLAVKLRLPLEPGPGPATPEEMDALWDIRSIGRWGRRYAARAALGGFLEEDGLRIRHGQATIASADGPVDIRMVTGIEFSARATTYSLTKFGGQFLAWAVHDNHLCVDSASHLTLEKKEEPDALGLI